MALYRGGEARAIDAAAIAAGLPAFTLMQRAGAAAFASLRRHWPQARCIAILCGGGNNGGDGYVLARLLQADGCQVRVFALTAARTHEAQRAAAEWMEAGGRIEPIDAETEFGSFDLLVDAIFGIGLARAPEGLAARVIGAINASDAPVLALDLPSGLDADSGAAPGACVRATRTLSFIAAKRGLFTGMAREVGGLVEVASLEVPAAAFDTCEPSAYLCRTELLPYWLRPRSRVAHKGDHGQVLAVGGDHGYAGAIHLCAEAALRSGAGLVRVATRAEQVPVFVGSRPEAMPAAVEDADALRLQAKGADVIALGPGLGQERWGREMFEAALALERALVLDADALNLLAQAPRALSDAVLTPHPGEAARLLGTTVAVVEADRFAAAQALAQRYAATVVLKGAGSIVAAPGRVAMVIDAGNPGMASGGMGDVLTGVVAALRAQGLAGFDAACAGALLHGAAGDAAARDGGERGLLASDLFPFLRRLANPA